MMLSPVVDGVLQAATVYNLLWCLLGVTMGTLIGVLPGLGPLGAISLLLPLVMQMNDTVPALIMLAGIYYGSQYGGSTTSILLNMPGESASVVTAIDGYAMTQQGRAGTALFFAAVGSFVAGLVATVVIAMMGPPLSEFGLRFASPEMACLMLLGLVGAAMIFPGDVVKNICMIVLGLLLSLIGTDINSAMIRFNFGWLYLSNGIEIAVMAMGMFGLAEIVRSLHRVSTDSISPWSYSKISGKDWHQAWPACLRGTMIGSVLGVIPGGGAILASYASYAAEKRIMGASRAKQPGQLSAVVGPESANNAGAQTSFIPMLTLGMPTNPVVALLLAVMISHGIQPGPQIMTEHADLFWTLVASMVLGNAMLLVLNLPLIKIWIRICQIPMTAVYPVLIVIMCAGAFSIKNNIWDIVMLIPFALLGLWLTYHRCNIAVLIMAFILGQMLEENLRRSLVISHGDWGTFLERPVSVWLLGITAMILILPCVRWIWSRLVLTYPKVDQ